MNVLLDVSAVPDRPAGAGRYIVELARALGSRTDVDLELVTRRGDTTRWRLAAERAEVRSWVPAARPLRLAYERAVLGRKAGRPGTGRSGRSRRSGTSGDWVYHGPHYTLPAGLRSARVVTVHDLTFFDHPEWHERSKVRYFRAAIRRSSQLADVLICVSATTARRLTELVDVRGEVIVAEHGVDHRRFRPGAPDLSMLPPELRGGQAELVVHVGTLEPRKGIVDLVKAFGALASDRPAARLVLAGIPGWGAAEVSAAVAASPSRDRISQLGWVPDETVIALMRAAGVVAYPSREEGFGLPALEAMAVGAPLVTTAGTAMAEFSGEAAWLARPADSASLAATIETALEAPPEERARRRADGLARAASFTWERTSARHVEAYRLALERASSRRAP